MTPLIRAAAPADADAIARVHVQSWRETYRGLIPDNLLDGMTDSAALERRRAMWSALVARPDPVQVAIEGGQVVAFASGGAPQDHPGYDAELHTLYSLRAAQGQGTGRALLRGVAGALRAGGARNLALWVLDSNPTRNWYVRQGAREAGEKQDGALREVRMVWDDLDTLAD